MIVVDASAVAAMLFGEPDGSTIAAHLQGETLVAPDLIDYELAHTCEKKIRRHADRHDELMTMFRALRDFGISRVSVPLEEIIPLALTTGLSTYDACYLWLALARDVELVTLDHRLARVNAEIRG